MKKILFVLAAATAILSQPATCATYYTTSAGNWTDNIWGTTTTGAGSPLPALNDGDVLYIDDDILITTLVNIAADIIIVINATVTISGQLRVGEGSIFQFPSSSGRLVNSGTGNSAKIVIGNGGPEWSGNEGTVTGPGSFEDGWTCCTLTLPVTLTYFEADADQEGVLLKWATTMEENFREFVVERSVDGLVYEAIGTVEGKGFDIYDIETRYRFVDRHPIPGVNYYRLKAMDFDDTFEHFGVRAVKVTAHRQVAVYPNPSTGDAISFNLNFNPGENAMIILLDQRGMEVFRTRASTRETGISFENKLGPGIYILRYISDDLERTSRVIIKN